MQTAAQIMHKSPKVKKIEDVVKPDATMRLHQRLFDRRRKHRIDVREEAGPGSSLSAYLISPTFRRSRKAPTQQNSELITTAPAAVIQYSQITRQVPEEDFLEHQTNSARSFADRIAQRYRVFVSQHKPFYYSLSSGTASGWLHNPRARVALAGSALALLVFFTGKPYTPPTGPDNPTGKNPVVIQETSGNAGVNPVDQASTSPSSGAQSPSPATTPTTSQTPPSATPAQTQTSPAITLPTNGGGYGSGPVSTTPSSTPTTSQTSTSTTSTDLIQDIIKPTPVTLPGQDIKVDDKRILQTTDTTITIN